MQDKLALNNQLQLSKQQASSLENQLQQVTHVLGIKQQEHERELDALHNQLKLLHHQYEEVRQSHQHTVLQQTQQQHAESVPWGRVRDILDAALVSLRRAKGLLSSGPIDQSDRRSIQEFDFKEVKKQLMETTHHLSSLMFSVGQRKLLVHI